MDYIFTNLQKYFTISKLNCDHVMMQKKKTFVNSENNLHIVNMYMQSVISIILDKYKDEKTSFLPGFSRFFDHNFVTSFSGKVQ